MSIIDIPIKEHTVEDAVLEIRQAIESIVSHAEISLSRIRGIVAQYDRKGIADRLGNDAQSMLVVYAKLKETVEIAKGIEVEDLS